MEQSKDEQIEKLRGRMTRSAMEKGRGHPETIDLSRQLDQLMNQYASGQKRLQYPE